MVHSMWKTRLKRAEQVFEKILQYERKDEKIKWKSSDLVEKVHVKANNLLILIKILRSEKGILSIKVLI